MNYFDELLSPGVVPAGCPLLEDGGAGPRDRGPEAGGCAGLVLGPGGRHQPRARAQASHVPRDHGGAGAKTQAANLILQTSHCV